MILQDRESATGLGTLSNKCRATYEKMFGAVHQQLILKFGDVGAVHLILTDFELVAVQAVLTVFPEVKVKGCSFHFRQALIR